MPPAMPNRLRRFQKRSYHASIGLNCSHLPSWTRTCQRPGLARYDKLRTAMRRLATHPPAAASMTCTDAPIPIRLFIIRPVKRSASTAPDGTPGKKLLSNNFVVRRHVPPWGRNVSIPCDFLSTGRQDTFGRNPRNVCRSLTALQKKYDTGVSIGRWSRGSVPARAEEPIFPAVSSRRRKSETRVRRSRMHSRGSSARNSARSRSWIGIALSQCGQSMPFCLAHAHRTRYWKKSFF